MSAREDLLKVAEALADRASGMVGVNAPGQHTEAAELARGAKAALEAAALVDLEPAPIIAALERLGTHIQDAGTVEAILAVGGTADAIDHVAEQLVHYQREIEIGAAVQHGYIRLRDLAATLLRDFASADTDTARRIAARIETALDEAEEAIENAKGDGS